MDPSAPAAILFTSGTTGRQKGATLSHANIASNVSAVNRYMRTGPADRVLVALPLFHVAAQNVLMNGGFAAAATLVLHRRFDTARCAAAIEEHRVTIVIGVPTIYISLLSAGVPPPALASVRLYKSSAATMPVEIARRWRDTYGQTVMEGYGLTETSPASTFNHEYEYRAGSVGTPIDLVDMRVVDEDDREVPPGAWGEVVFRGPNVMLGYWNRPEDTRTAMRGGWFHTGDVGYVDDAGYLYLVDRMKDMINTAGLKIWPREVEEVLYRHPAIRECAVVGSPDAVKGEIAKAVVVTRSGAVRPTPEDLDAYCRAPPGRLQGAARVRVRRRAAQEPVGQDPEARPAPGRAAVALMADRSARSGGPAAGATVRPRAEHVGSFLRPDRLLGAARDARAGRLSAERFRELQDQCVREVVAFQEGLGFRTVTDGEFRRRGWSAGFIDAVDGFGLREAALGFRDEQGERGVLPSPYARARLHRARGIAIDELRFLRGVVTTGLPKVTMPAPDVMHFFLGPRSVDPDVYPDIEAYYADLVAIYRAEIRDLAALG